MLSRHEYFEQLCALAAIGEISTEELTVLRAHLGACLDCRQEFAGYRELVHQQLPLADLPPKPKNKFLISFVGDDGVRERFYTRARNRSFQFSEGLGAASPFWLGWGSRSISLAIAALALGALTVFGYQLRKAQLTHNAAESELISLKTQNEELRRQLSGMNHAAEPATSKPEQTSATPLPKQPLQPVELAPAAALTGGETATLEAQLANAREENASLLLRVKAADEQLQALGSQNQTLQVDIAASRNSESDAGTKLNEATARINQLTEELRKSREGRSADASVIAAQESRLKEIADKVKEQTESMDRQKQLLAADRDIRDLMTARNLHIIDTYDVDGKGATRRTFGRVFYTEAKSLIYYAFDLDDKRIFNANYAVQAWGYQEPGGQSKSLGIFYADDRKQNRWAFKFNDPLTLSQIDAVFLTIEPPGGSTKPTGQKRLYAYLRNKPNHP
jgi:hypothetical protein